MTFAGGLLIVAMFSHSSENRCRISRRHRSAALGLVCAAIALACLAFISFPPTFDIPITKANPNSGHLWTTSIPQKIPRTLRPLYRMSNGDMDGDSSAKLTENGRPLGPGGALHEDIRQMGQGRYSHLGGALYFSTSDNSDPTANDRAYVVTITAKPRIFIYQAGGGFAGLALLLFILWIKKLTFSEFFRETIAGLQRRKRAWHEALQRDRANFAFETFVRTHFRYGLGMFLLAFVLLSTLWPPFFEATFEADTDIQRVRIFQDIFSGKAAIGDIQPPPNHVYFDGHYIIYAFASLVIKYGAALSSRLNFSPIAAENVNELIIFTIYFVNTCLLALACAFLFHFVLRVTKNIVPAMLFALVFICSYQTITAFNLIRSDAFITSCLLILLCFSVSFALGRLHKHSYLVAGIFSALLVCTKVTAFLFLLIPLLAFFMQRKNAVFRNEMYKYALVLCTGTLLLQFRYIIYPGHILSNPPAILMQMREWNALMSKTDKMPLFYYNIDIYRSEPFFLALTLLGVVINIFGVRKNKSSPILLASFFFFSLMGLSTPKAPRWGYHIFLLALFLLITAHLYVEEKVRLTRWRRLYSLSVLLLAAGLLFDGGKNFLTTKRGLADRYNNELRVQIAAASWLRNNIPAKEKICILTASNWQMPPGDFNYVNEGFFIEYTNPEALANYRLPDVSELPASCPIFILGSAHLDLYGAVMASHNLHVDWYGYFAMLEKRFPPVVFESEDKKNWLKIFRFNSHK
jgi:hypothetical protein